MPQGSYAERAAARRAALDKLDAQRGPSMVDRIQSGLDWANKPLVNFPIFTDPKQREALDYFREQNPNVAPWMEFGAGVVSSQSSPLSLGLGGVAGAAPLAKGLGMAKTAEGLRAASRGASIGMMGHGAYNLYNAETNPERVGAALEMVGGGLGARANRRLPSAPIEPPKPPPTGVLPGSQTAHTWQPPQAPPNAYLGAVEPVRTGTGWPSAATPGPSKTRVSNVAPTKVSAGMGARPANQMSPAQAAFEALVPDRYKTELTTEGLTLNLNPQLADVGPIEVPHAPATSTAAPAKVATSPKTATTPKKATTPTVKKPAATTTLATDAPSPEVQALVQQFEEALRKKEGAPAQIPAPTKPQTAAEKLTAELKRKAEAKAARAAEFERRKAEAKAKAAANAEAIRAREAETAAQNEAAKQARMAGREKSGEQWRKMAEDLKAQGKTDLEIQAAIQEARTGKPSTVKPKQEKAPKAQGEYTGPNPKTTVQENLEATLAEDKKWIKFAEELRAAKIPEEQISELIAKGRAGEIASAPASEVVPAKPSAPKTPVLKGKAQAPAPATQAIPERRPSDARPHAYAKDSILESRALKGDKAATQELAWRKAEDAAEAAAADADIAGKVEKGRLSFRERMSDETGAAGRGTEELMRTRAEKAARKGAERAAEAAWKEGQLEMGFPSVEIDRAIKLARRAGIDPTRSDDLYDLGEYMQGWDPFGNKGEQSVGRGVLAGPTEAEAALQRAQGKANNESLIAQNRAAYEARQQAGSEQIGEVSEPGGFFRQLFENEEGAVGSGAGYRRRNRSGPALTGWRGAATDATENLNQLRMASMLSGLAIPKSILGNIGAHFTAAAENKSLAPLKQLGNVSQIGRDIKAGWDASNTPALGGVQKSWNLPGRILGAGDYAATESLMRAGLTKGQAQEILLTNPNPMAGHKTMNTPIAKLIVPFKTTPFNQMFQGFSRYQKYPKTAAAAVGLGAGAGALTDDPEKLALGAGFAGPHAYPFMLGALTTAGARSAQGISPIPEWSIIKTLTEPWAAFTESPGKRWFEPNFGFGSDSKPKTKGRPTQRKQPKRPSRRD